MKCKKKVCQHIFRTLILTTRTKTGHLVISQRLKRTHEISNVEPPSSNAQLTANAYFLTFGGQ